MSTYRSAEMAIADRHIVDAHGIEIGNVRRCTDGTIWYDSSDPALKSSQVARWGAGDWTTSVTSRLREVIAEWERELSDAGGETTLPALAYASVVATLDLGGHIFDAQDEPVHRVFLDVDSELTYTTEDGPTRYLARRASGEWTDFVSDRMKGAINGWLRGYPTEGTVTVAEIEGAAWGVSEDHSVPSTDEQAEDAAVDLRAALEAPGVDADGETTLSALAYAILDLPRLRAAMVVHGLLGGLVDRREL